LSRQDRRQYKLYLRKANYDIKALSISVVLLRSVQLLFQFLIVKIVSVFLEIFRLI